MVGRETEMGDAVLSTERNLDIDYCGGSNRDGPHRPVCEHSVRRCGLVRSVSLRRQVLRSFKSLCSSLASVAHSPLLLFAD